MMDEDGDVVDVDHAPKLTTITMNLGTTMVPIAAYHRVREDDSRLTNHSRGASAPHVGYSV